MNTNGLVVAGLALVLAGGTPAAAYVETYSVNAQYRGAVRKGFQELGEGTVAYDALGAAGFRVEARARVRHPEENKEYAFHLAERYRIRGDTITREAVERRELNEHARPHEARVTEVLPFAYLVRLLPPPQGGGDPARSFKYRNREYTLRYRSTERHLEVELYREDDFIGKFFLLREKIGGVTRLEKFRVAIPEEKLVISFIVTAHQARPQPGR